MSKGKKLILWIVIAFVVYAIFTAPVKAGNATGGFISFGIEGFHSIGVFFDAIIRQIPA